MQLTTVAPNSTLSEFQIQKNIQKVSFSLASAKAAATAAAAQLLADAAQIFITVKRMSKTDGEQPVITRSPLAELMALSASLMGNIYTTGTDAATSYTGETSIELSLDGNIDLQAGEYLTLTVENPVAGCTITVAGVPSSHSSRGHLRWSRVSLTANEAKRVQVKRIHFVGIPSNIIDGRLVGNDSVTITANTVAKLIYEISQPIKNVSGGQMPFPSYVALPAGEIDFIDFTNGGTGVNIYLLEQVRG